MVFWSLFGDISLEYGRTTVLNFAGGIMKSLVLALLILLGTSNTVSASEGHSRVLMHSELAPVVSAGTLNYSFSLKDVHTNQKISDSDLRISHEKKLHFLIYDSSLKEFQHLHPEFDGQSWRVSFDLLVDGDYWVWTQGELAADGSEFSAVTKLSVANGLPAWALPPALGDNRVGLSGNSVVELSGEEIRSGGMVMLTVKFSRNDGTSPSLQNYLGAFAHVVAVPSSGDQLLHVHPMSMGPNEGMIHATFPEKGDYRLWIQFIDGSELKTVALSISVK